MAFYSEEMNKEAPLKTVREEAVHRVDDSLIMGTSNSVFVPQHAQSIDRTHLDSIYEPS